MDRHQADATEQDARRSACERRSRAQGHLWVLRSGARCCFFAERFARSSLFIEPDQADAIGPVLFAKIIRFSLHPKQIYIYRRSGPIEGRFAVVTNVGPECGGRGWRLMTKSATADGEVVWS
jgi:hypothetical protein